MNDQYKVIIAVIVQSALLFPQAVLAQPESPQDVRATPWERHIEVRWNKTTDPSVSSYRVYRAGEDGLFAHIRSFGVNDTLWIDFTGAPDITYRYYITTRTGTGMESDASAEVTATTFIMSDDQFLDMVQEYTFRYFWDFAHPVSGLARERNTSGDIVTTGGSGFGVMAILTGIERGYITWDEGLARLLRIVLFLENADRFFGAYPHWMHGATGRVIPFSALDDGGDIVETAFLFQGLLTVREYFIGNTTDEIVLRHKITTLWEEINWNWYRNNGNVMLWHWSPQHGFAINLPVRGWNETMMVYLLGVASPTHPIPSSLYHTGWAGGNYVNGFSIYGYTLDVGPLTGGPLFFAHYSFIGFDPRPYRDQYANYFVQNRNHTLINRAYCIHNPGGYVGYSEVCWGLTASDDPLVGYLAHEATPALDNGTIAPTAAISSIPYTPAESIEALKHFYREYGDRLWGPMGFYDAFNLTHDWFAESYLAIDQGPMICMIENYRTQLLWNLFMRNQELIDALEAVGFVPDTTFSALSDVGLGVDDIILFPVPASDVLYVQNHTNKVLQVQIVAMHGEKVLTHAHLSAAGTTQIPTGQLPPGLYMLIAEDGRGARLVQKVVLTAKERE